MTTIDQRQPVLITGAGGYLASWIVKYLLEAGYHVRATVRNKNDFKKIGHLLDIRPGEGGILELFEADLTRPGDFNKAMRGCEVVFHTASPFLIGKVKDPQKQLVDPALEGVRNVLYSAAETPTMKRVVLTSSVVAMYCDAREILDKPSKKFNEEDWNRIADLQYEPYAFSKTIAEKTAWALMHEQKQWDLVSLNPAFIFGPPVGNRADGASVATLQRALSGEMRIGAPDLAFGIVDVRDVAQAHILAAFNPEASGRYLLSKQSMSFLELANEIDAAFPGKYKLPNKVLPKWLVVLLAPVLRLSKRYLRNNLGYRPEFDNTRSTSLLGLSYRPVRETIGDMVRGIEGAL